jgi:HAD superfamily hydrolase (TIGR01509 family)
MNTLKNNTILVFDLHEVLFTFDYKKIVKLIWQFNHKWTIIATLFHFGLIWQLLKLLLNDATDEEFYDLFEQKHPILFPLILEMTNAQKIIPGTDHIIKDLVQQNYTLHILSNIGPRRFTQLSNDFPQFIDYFKRTKIVDPNDTPCFKKPDTQFFIDYLKEYTQPEQQVILIDDNKKNITIARSLGMTAIHFRSAKQLRKQLQHLGILISA